MDVRTYGFVHVCIPPPTHCSDTKYKEKPLFPSQQIDRQTQLFTQVPAHKHEAQQIHLSEWWMTVQTVLSLISKVLCYSGFQLWSS